MSAPRGSGRRNRSRRFTAAAAVALGILIALPGTAHAWPGWQRFTLDDRWTCSTSYGVYANIGVCIVISSTNTQAVVTFKNVAYGAVEIEVPNMRLWVSGSQKYNVYCRAQSFNTSIAHACFGDTLSFPCTRHAQAWAQIRYRAAGGSWSSYSTFSPTMPMCSS